MGMCKCTVTHNKKILVETFYFIENNWLPGLNDFNRNNKIRNGRDWITPKPVKLEDFSLKY